MKLNTLKLRKLNFWQQWLLISVIVWLVLMLASMGAYTYNAQVRNLYPATADGIRVTFGEKFLSYNLEQLIWLTIAYFILLAEANYKFVFKRKSTRYFLLSCYMFGELAVLYFTLADEMKFGVSYGLKQIFILGALFGLFFLIYALVRDFIYDLVFGAEIKLEKSQAELNALKAQVNPHFFFNTLNSIYGTALEENAPRTADSIEQLAGIMRYTMNEAQENYTAVANEVRFIEEYLHLQRLRLPERQNIDLQTTINYDGKPCEVAPMLLIPFIENAFKYGISIDHPCFVHIELLVANQQLRLIVENSISSHNPLHQSHGTGIRNTQKRLQLLYPGTHHLNITHHNETFKVELELQLNTHQPKPQIIKTHTYEKVS